MIKEKIRSIPDTPGVYVFKNAHKEIIYIGKAKSLKKRVGSYFVNHQPDFKLDMLVPEIADLDYIPTNTENEALLLEAQLVKEHQPRFNVLLKDGQPFVYLMLTTDEMPEFTLVRNQKRKGTYFGPFVHKGQAWRVHAFLTRMFGLKLCNKKIDNGCLQYHLGICVGNCADNFDRESYLFKLELVKKILKRQYDEFADQVTTKISELSDAMEFEKAKQLRDYLENLANIQRVIKTNYRVDKYDGFVSIVTADVQQAPQANGSVGEELQKLLTLEKAPVTIDCFDISHFQSRYIVGSCVRFTDGAPDKPQFRRFRIKTLEQQNDYAALAEIVKRRYRKPEELPDLILIDGGKGQLNAVQDLFENTEWISLAKREERVFSRKHPYGVVLDIHTNSGKTLMALRDYAHHFAISYHRKRRSMNLL